MIVDAHTHILDKDWLPDLWWDALAEIYVHELQRLGTKVTKDDVKRMIFPQFYDPNGDKLLKEMDRAGIDVSIVFAVDFGLALGEPRVSIEEQNRRIAKLQDKHPDRIVALFTIDPRRPSAVDLFETAVKEWGMRGLKLHPGAGFYPNSKEVYRMLEKARELRVPVLFHTGQVVQPLRSKYCDPIYIDDLLIDFHDLTIQVAHLSFGWRYELFHMGSTKTNLVADFSGWQLTARNNPTFFCQVLREAIDAFGPDRILFGTDGPYLRAAMPDKDFVNFIRTLPEKAPAGIKFTEKEINMILGENAARIYGIEIKK
ncbi:MAG: amidohydrolase family protein [Candidatus Baldrarchaeia archaeon]